MVSSESGPRLRAPGSRAFRGLPALGSQEAPGSRLSVSALDFSRAITVHLRARRNGTIRRTADGGRRTAGARRRPAPGGGRRLEPGAWSLGPERPRAVAGLAGPALRSPRAQPIARYTDNHDE